MTRKYRRGTSYKVSFPTAPSLTALPAKVELHQEASSHDILILEYPKASSLWFEVLKTGTPVVFSWTQDNKGYRWVGYVNIVSKQSAAQKQRTMKVICVGASFVLKQKATRTFKNSTVVEAAEKIAKEFGFSFVGDPGSRRFDALSIAGQSYWEWLQEQAQRIGYGLVVVNCTMYLRPLDKFIDATSFDVPSYTSEMAGPVSGANLYDRTLDSFTVLNGDYVEDGFLTTRTARVSAGVSPATGKLTTHVSSPSDSKKKLRGGTSGTLFTAYSDEVVHTKGSAKSSSLAESQARRFTVPALIIGQGDPGVHPLVTVHVQGTGVDTDGYWVVSKVVHSFRIAGDYQTEMRVHSDGLGGTLPSSLRKTDGHRTNAINLNENVIEALQADKRVFGTRLISKQPVVVESQQGFLQLGTVWSGR